MQDLEKFWTDTILLAHDEAERTGQADGGPNSKIVDTALVKMYKGCSKYGGVDPNIKADRDFSREALDELVDALNYMILSMYVKKSVNKQPKAATIHRMGLLIGLIEQLQEDMALEVN